MDRNDHRTMVSAAMAFDMGSIDMVIGEIECHANLEVKASGDGRKKYDVLTVLGGRNIVITNIALNGDKYLASFGIIPSRDFEDEGTRKEAEEIVDYLRKVFGFYAGQP